MQWPKHHQPVPSQCKEGGPTAEGITEGGKEYISDILPGSPLRGALLGKHLYPKYVVKWLGYLMHAREVSRKKPKVLPFKGERVVHRRTKWMRVCRGIHIGRKRK